MASILCACAATIRARRERRRQSTVLRLTSNRRCSSASFRRTRTSSCAFIFTAKRHLSARRSGGEGTESHFSVSSPRTVDQPGAPVSKAERPSLAGCAGRCRPARASDLPWSRTHRSWLRPSDSRTRRSRPGRDNARRLDPWSAGSGRPRATGRVRQPEEPGASTRRWFRATRDGCNRFPSAAPQTMAGGLCATPLCHTSPNSQVRASGT